MAHNKVVVLLPPSDNNYYNCVFFNNNIKWFCKTQNPPTPELNSKEFVGSITGKHRLIQKSKSLFYFISSLCHPQFCLGPRLQLQHKIDDNNSPGT